MISSTLYVRVVKADKDRGFLLLAGFDPKVIQRTASSMTTLTNVTRASLDAAIARMQEQYRAKEVKDVTDEGIAKRLARDFGETGSKATPPAANTFAGMGIGSYLPKS